MTMASSSSVVFVTPPALLGNPNPNLGNRLRLPTRPLPGRLAVRASALPPPPALLSSSTRTVVSLLGGCVALLRSLASRLPTPDELAGLASLGRNPSGRLFFAMMSSRGGPEPVRTPLTILATGLGRWLEIYSGVLMVRVLLSWFPNVPWDRQPLAAIRDLCDPYLNIFRNIIPPIFDALDVSPLLAFSVLGIFSILLTFASTV